MFTFLSFDYLDSHYDATTMINQTLVKPNNKVAVRTHASAVKPVPEP